MKDLIHEAQKPSIEEQRIALESYDTLIATIGKLKSENPEIEIEETAEKIKIPLKALKLLAHILRTISEGRPVALVSEATELTTQSAAEMLGFSRPYLIKLLEEGKIPYTTVGRHRRIRVDDIIKFKKQQKANQKTLLVEMMRDDEASGLYDS